MDSHYQPQRRAVLVDITIPHDENLVKAEKDKSSTLKSQPQGLQDWFTDLDGWICRFSANVKLSRLQSKPDATNLDYTCENCSQELKSTKNRHTATHTRPVTPITLHDIIVNGLLIAQKRKKDKMTNIEEFLNIFKGTDDFAYYDYVLLTTVKENGTKHLKYIRSKI